MNFYKQAATAIDHLDTKQGSVKGSIAAAGVGDGANGKEGKRILALVIESLKYRTIIQGLSDSLKLLQVEKKTFPQKVPSGAPSSKNLLLVLLHDLLFSKDAKIQASDKWPPKQAIMRHATRLKAELVKLQIKKGLTTIGAFEMEGGNIAAMIPRYVRCNNNVAEPETLIEHLTSGPKPFKMLDTPSYPPAADTFFRDPHLEELLVFPPSTKFDQNPDYLNGGLILQDKASCFPAKVLMHDWAGAAEGEVIDGTAAPGNKTSFISALMGNRGKVHAFERSHQRYKTLQKMLDRAGCKNVEARRGDFLESKPEDFANVTRILLDPSCSGSGIVNRLDYLLEDAEPEADDVKVERLDKLASFQLQMIRHAMKFPAVQRIVYSTCSVHKEEDEDVVMNALGSSEAADYGWALAPRAQTLPTWERRGLPEHMNQDQTLADGVIRCVPGEDHTNGFFVSCFVKKQVAPTGQGQKRKLAQAADFPEESAGEDEDDERQELPVEDEEVGEASGGKIPNSKKKKKKNKRKKQKKVVHA
ncbi:hypothetical protein NliqN6_4156 [Naganishia liquefaciens]|uniref:SAM-dependent MTase RsmB/NOP-type domain-containing protein n=1 Tax=Naganishia liquefaciens TaxID=104408 RepID=A0A8H3TX07_9TREE|nr:hypothetical protein NliqN6_4156 [Naganishia liquefaciens]